MVRAFIVVALLTLLPTMAQAEKRLALLIGNQAYSSEIGRLVNPHNDVALLEKTLKGLGFEVATLRDAGLATLHQAVNAYARRVRAAGPDAVDFFYYSGHGAQDAGTNYLIPVDVKSAETGELWDQSLRLTEITRKLKGEAGNAAHFVVFDACRNALKLKQAGSRALLQSKGFAPVREESGMLIAYATAEGELASDVGVGAGPYAKVLAEEIVKPGVGAVTMFRRVQVRVRVAIGQDPWLGFSALGVVNFAGEAPAPPTPAAASAPQAARLSEAAEAWDRTKDATSDAILQAFIVRYKDTFYADLARSRIEKLKKQKQVATASPPPALAPPKPAQPAATVAPAPAQPVPKNLSVPAAAITPTPPHAQYSDGIIKIGVLNAQTGPTADPAGQGSFWAARRAIEDFCRSTKCHDKIDVVLGDHQGRPDVGANFARQWYDADKVDVVVDIPISPVAIAVNQVAREKNRVALASGAASPDLTGKFCSPNAVHWTYDLWALANGAGRAIVKTGGDTWFFLTADVGFSQALEHDTEAAVLKNGGRVLGKVLHPLGNLDFSSHLVQAKASGAKIIGLANAGGSSINSIRQAAELGIVEGGQSLAGLLANITDVHALGLKTAQGLLITEAWYWDGSDNNRAFAKEFAAANKGSMPTMVHAGVYSAVTHYLKAVHELGSDADGTAVVAKMKSMPTDDKLFGKGMIRADGRKIHDMYLMEVKKPAESKSPWDYYKIRATIPAAEAFRPIEQGDCPLVKK